MVRQKIPVDRIHDIVIISSVRHVVALIFISTNLRMMDTASPSRNIRGKARIHGAPFSNFPLFGDDSSAPAEPCHTTPREMTENTHIARKLFSKWMVIGPQNRVNKKWERHSRSSNLSWENTLCSAGLNAAQGECQVEPVMWILPRPLGGYCANQKFSLLLLGQNLFKSVLFLNVCLLLSLSYASLSLYFFFF